MDSSRRVLSDECPCARVSAIFRFLASFCKAKLTTVSVRVYSKSCYLLCAYVVAVDKEADAAVFHDSSAVENEDDVVPLTLLRQLRAPETHRALVKDWLMLKLIAS